MKTMLVMAAVLLLGVSACGSSSLTVLDVSSKLTQAGIPCPSPDVRSLEEGGVEAANVDCGNLHVYVFQSGSEMDTWLTALCANPSGVTDFAHGFGTNWIANSDTPSVSTQAITEALGGKEVAPLSSKCS